MTTRTTTETAGSPAQLTLNPDTVTPAMNDSLQSMHSTLLCPLCHQVFTDPSTLPCAHTFCLSCMDEYAANAWACPIPGCGFPLACRGSREGSYLKINPQIQTVVSSLQEICQALNNAPKEWWVQDENEAESKDGKVVDSQQTSPSQDSRQEEDGSPQDSVQTRAFERPTSDHDAAPHDWMDPIAEAGNDNRSCGLPSQSPNCSPIAIVASQVDVEHNVVSDDRRTTEHNNANDKTKDESLSLVERNETSTVRFQENVDIMDTKMPSVPTVMIASALSDKDREMLQQVANKMKLVTTDCGGNADLAVCANAEMETGDGYLIGRTYGYLLAVARGIPIVNISFFADKQANLEALNENGNKHQVIGEADSSEWMAPQRAMKNKREKEGTTLLDGYTVLLFGDFDSLPKASSAKRVRSGAAKNEEQSQTVYSLDRLECLLQACGASVAKDLSSLVGLEDKVRVAVMIRPDPRPRDIRAARKELEDYPTLPLIRGNWLLDSISDFSVKEFADYEK